MRWTGLLATGALLVAACSSEPEARGDGTTVPATVVGCDGQVIKAAHSSIVRLAPDGHVAWRVDLGPEPGVNQALPILDGDRVLSSGGGALRALGLDLGDERWRRPVVGVVFATWLHDGIYVALVDQVSDHPASLVAVDATTGEDRWTLEAGVGILGTPVLTDDGALASIDRGSTVTVVDLATGTVRWRTSGGGDVGEGGRIAAAPGSVLATDGRTLTAYASVDGTLRWSAPFPPLAGITVAGDAAVDYRGILPDPTPVRAFDLADGHVRWEVSVDPAIGVDITPAGDAVLLTVGQRAVSTPDPSGEPPWPHIELVDLATGAVRWTAVTPWVASVPAVVTQDTVLFASVDLHTDVPELHRYALADGADRGSVPLDGTPGWVTAGPGGRAFVGVAEEVVALEPDHEAWRARPDEALSALSGVALPDGGVLAEVDAQGFGCALDQ